MGRSCYSDDFGDEFPGQINLFRANVRRSMHSKTGQTRLRELRDALIAMPVKELHEDLFVDVGSGKVCGLGAWAVAHCNGDLQAAHDLVLSSADDFETHTALLKFGWPRLVVWELIYENDEASAWRKKNFSAAMRFDHVLSAVNRWLVTPDVTDNIS